jgi:branched-chain amino acid transport system substrate-binding protein
MTKRSFVLLLVASLLSLSPISTVSAEQELTIATILPMTGIFSRGGVQRAEGDKDYVDIVNEEGGIGGKKIKLVIEDGQWKSDVAMSLYQKIMSTENPLVFFAQNTEQAKAIGPYFKNRYKMLVGSPITGFATAS